jgi:hypothetical protein
MFRKKEITCQATEEASSINVSCIDLTSSTSITGQTLDSLSSTKKRAVDDKINKTLKKAINQMVKDVVSDVAHRELLEEMITKHLT